MPALFLGGAAVLLITIGNGEAPRWTAVFAAIAIVGVTYWLAIHALIDARWTRFGHPDYYRFDRRALTIWSAPLMMILLAAGTRWLDLPRGADLLLLSPVLVWLVASAAYSASGSTGVVNRFFKFLLGLLLSPIVLFFRAAIVAVAAIHGAFLLLFLVALRLREGPGTAPTSTDERSAPVHPPERHQARQPITASTLLSVAGGRMTLTQVVRAWLAFKELRRRDALRVSLPERALSSARSAGWDLPVFGGERRYLEMMDDHPFDFYRGFEFGVDLGVAGQGDFVLVHPKDLADMATRLSAADQDGSFAVKSAIVAPWLDRLIERLQHAESQEQHPAVDAPVSYTRSPFILPNPVRALLWEYGIANGKVYSRKRFRLGPGPSLDIKSVVNVRAEGGIVLGDVHFSNEVERVVTWKNVLRPERTWRHAEAVIESDASRHDARARHERACPECAELILVRARRCKHCGATVTPSASGESATS